MRSKTLLSFAFLFTVTGSVLAQTAETGAIIGRVLETATPLPGATDRVSRGTATDNGSDAGRFDWLEGLLV